MKFLFFALFMPFTLLADGPATETPFHVAHVNRVAPYVNDQSYDDDMDKDDKYSFHRYLFTDPFFTVMVTKYNSFSPKTIIIGEKNNCSTKRYKEFESLVSQTSFLRIEPCAKGLVPPAILARGWAIYDKENMILRFPFPPYVTGTKLYDVTPETEIIQNKILKYVENKKFLSQDDSENEVIIKAKSYTVDYFSHIKFSDDFYSTRAAFKTQTEPVQKFSSIFLTYKGEIWPVAHTSNVSEISISNLSKVFFKENGEPFIIEFESPDYFYIIDFGNTLLSVKIERYQFIELLEGPNNDMKFGFKPENAEKSE